MHRTLTISGMHCPACVDRLTRAFAAVAGVSHVTVTLSPPRAVLETHDDVALAALAHAAHGAGNYTVTEGADAATSATTTPTAERPPSLYPLFLIVGYIALAAGLATYFRGDRSLHAFANDFMAGFFLVFSFFKLLDLRGFADAYQSYDLLARRARAWAFAYPFVELALGLAFLTRWQPAAANIATLVLMLIGAAGVLRALLRKDRIRCACLGTALNLPMTTVTLVEDLGMAAMAAAMLLWPA